MELKIFYFIKKSKYIASFNLLSVHKFKLIVLKFNNKYALLVYIIIYISF